jgi:hypothetical protein
LCARISSEFRPNIRPRKIPIKICKTAWGIKPTDPTEAPVHIQEAANGKRCGLVCPVCRDALIARQGDLKTWHFAHQPGVERNCGESVLHFAAKKLVVEAARAGAVLRTGRVEFEAVGKDVAGLKV